MKTIGLLGGMSWVSTELYYRIINEEVGRALGGLHSARIAMVSVDFQEIEKLQRDGDWDAAGEILVRGARQVEEAGADLLLICANTMHRVAEPVEAAIGIPLLHVADATAARVQQAGIEKVGLLGTRFTMEQDFYRGRLVEEHGLEVVLPSEADRELVHGVIYEELCLGTVREESRREFLRIMDRMREEGARGIIQGCTEIVLLVRQHHTDTPLFDTARIHAEEAVTRALA